MSKLRDQLSINDRLREYIERMLTVIMEHNPQLLEVTTSSGVSIVSMGMSAMASNNSRTRTNVSENKSMSLTTTTTTTQPLKDPSADKYCRL